MMLTQTTRHRRIGYVSAQAFVLWLGLACPLQAAEEWLGSLSCSAATCHGNVAYRGPAWASSYTVSRTKDPHATAGTLLYEAVSQQIVTILSPQIAELEGAERSLQYDLVLRQRCISCHVTATPQDISTQDRLTARQIGEGVSCASCHGSAEKWLHEHTLASWQGESRFHSDTGMLDTESLVGRAEGCVRCHVGSRTADGIVRDMNHDLIAAGHPALRFDLLIYNDNLPPHWNPGSEVEQAFARSQLRVRQVGRSIGLMAAAKLSSERAQDAHLPTDSPASVALPAAPTGQGPVPWPELSDFDCFGCHQALLPRSYRLPSNVDGKPKLEVSNGLPLWNAWFTAQSTSSGNPQAWSFRPKPGGQREWIVAANDIADLYRKKAIVDATSEVRPALQSIVELRRELNRKAPSDWNAAALIYLDMEAAAQDLAAQPVDSHLGKNLQAALQRDVRPLLLFEQGDGQELPRVRSPSQFDSREFRTTILKALNSVEDTPP